MFPRVFFSPTPSSPSSRRGLSPLFHVVKLYVAVFSFFFLFSLYFARRSFNRDKSNGEKERKKGVRELAYAKRCVKLDGSRSLGFSFDNTRALNISRFLAVSSLRFHFCDREWRETEMAGWKAFDDVHTLPPFTRFLVSGSQLLNGYATARMKSYRGHSVHCFR